MQPLETLSPRSKKVRLHKLACRALEQYDLEVTGLRLVGIFTNALFQVRTLDGPNYLLRICTPGWRTTKDLYSEAMWLQAIGRETDIGAPLPYPARNGEFLVEASSPGIPGPHCCMLMSWIPGVLLAKHLTEANLYKMGVLFARLHAHAATFSPPPAFTRRKMNRLYARGEEDILLSEECLEAFNPHNRDIFEATWAKVDTAFRNLYADLNGLRVIHNDLHHENIKIYHGRLYPLDFEDTLWGYPVQDIAMALQDLMMDISPEAYEPLFSAFRQGYESRAAWPETYAGQIDTFRAGRMIWVSNYVARFERPYLAEHIAWVSEMLERFLESGNLRKLTPTS